MKSICFFNNKGGVGKTTLICNVASYIGTHYNLRILLVDADPQCNSTQLILGDKEVEHLYESRAVSSGVDVSRPSHRQQTLYDILQPIAIGEATIERRIKPIPRTKNNFSIDLIPGDPSLSLIEDLLSQEWSKLLASDPSGLRKTNWNTQLCDAVTEDYDVIFFDVGPSLGALNRSVLVGVDYFVTPMGGDVFSLLGVKNISDWLGDWLNTYDRAVKGFSPERWKVRLEDFPIRTSSEAIARFIGYTVQQYITKSYGGQRRPTAAYERILKEIPNIVDKQLRRFLGPKVGFENLRLGDVPHMYSLVPLAQKVVAPIHKLDSTNGLVGSQYQQKETYVKFIEELSNGILKNASIRNHEHQL